MKHKLKYLQSLVTVALCVIMATAFTSCSDDDSDEPPTPKVEKRMKSIDDITFVYSNGQIVQVKTDYDSDNVKYTESSIKIGSDVYYLNNGLVSKYVESDNCYQKFTYEDGRIKTWKKYDEEGKLDEDIVFEWKDGVIVNQRELDESGDLAHNFQCTYNTEYDYGGAIAGLQSNSFFYDNLPECLIIQGYFGKLPKYLIYQINDTAPDGNGLNTFTYNLDNDGYPITMIWTSENGRAYPTDFVWESINK